MKKENEGEGEEETLALTTRLYLVVFLPVGKVAFNINNNKNNKSQYLQIGAAYN